MRAFYPALMLSALMLTGCLRHGTCAEEPDNRFCRDAGRPDAGAPRDSGTDAAMDAGPDRDADAGSDAAPDAAEDAGPCGACASERPYCVEGDGGFMCLECSEPTHCEPTEVCSSLGACVECELDDDCDASPNGSVCDDTSCVECAANLDCAGNPRGEICHLDTNTCGCTDSDDCAEGACRIDDGVCGSRVACLSCTDDTDCLPEHDCVEMFYGTPPVLRDSRYCLLRRPPLDGCTEPFLGSPTREPTSGPEAVYCGIGEGITTCEAVRGFVDGVDCSATACVGEGSACRTVSGAATRCTSRCAGFANCLPSGGAYGFECSTEGYCE